jgi:hypothetical protein
MAESKAPPKPKTVPLAKDLDGWEKLTIRAQTIVGKGDPNKPGYLKKEFQVLDAEGSPAPALTKGWISISDKMLLEDRVTLEFTVNVDSNAPLKELEQYDHFLLSVQAQLDLPQVKNALGIALGGAGLGPIGSIAADAAMNALVVEAKVKLKIPVPVARVTLRKFRWGELKDFDLFSHMDRSELGQLYQAGGDLFIPTKIKPVQSTNAAGDSPGQDPSASGTLNFADDIRIFDTEGELNWMGTSIRGIHDEDKDPERRYLIFRISTPGAPDLAPDSPTRPVGGDNVGIA